MFCVCFFFVLRMSHLQPFVVLLVIQLRVERHFPSARSRAVSFPDWLIPKVKVQQTCFPSLCGKHQQSSRLRNVLVIVSFKTAFFILHKRFICSVYFRNIRVEDAVVI